MAKNKRTYTKQQKAIIRRYYAKKTNEEFTYGNPVFVDEYPHFRQYKVSRHPALILKLVKHNKTGLDAYLYRDVTHSGEEEHAKYDTISPNPDPSDTEPMQINKRVRCDEVTVFSDRPRPWKYPK